MTHWMDMAKAGGVDALIGSHPLHFDGPSRLELLKYRQTGQKNPLVVGAAGYQRYVDPQHEGVKLSLARDVVGAGS